MGKSSTTIKRPSSNMYGRRNPQFSAPSGVLAGLAEGLGGMAEARDKRSLELEKEDRRGANNMMRTNAAKSPFYETPQGRFLTPQALIAQNKIGAGGKGSGIKEDNDRLRALSETSRRLSDTYPQTPEIKQNISETNRQISALLKKMSRAS